MRLVTLLLLFAGLLAPAHAGLFHKKADAPLYPELAEAGDRFSFIVAASPRIGPWHAPDQNHRNCYGALVGLANLIGASPSSARPAFLVINGDAVDAPRSDMFASLHHAMKPIPTRLMLVSGERDGADAPESMFLETQQVLCGHRRLCYSWDCGRWHFIALGSLHDAKAQKQMLAWLKRDLKAHSARPTMVFRHQPLAAPAATTGDNTPSVKLEHVILAQLRAHANVRYLLSGHKLVGVRESIESATRLGHLRLIDVPVLSAPATPATDYREFKQGITGAFYLMATVDGNRLTLSARKLLSQASRDYPAEP